MISRVNCFVMIYKSKLEKIFDIIRIHFKMWSFILWNTLVATFFKKPAVKKLQIEVTHFCFQLPINLFSQSTYYVKYMVQI